MGRLVPDQPIQIVACVKESLETNDDVILARLSMASRRGDFVLDVIAPNLTIPSVRDWVFIDGMLQTCDFSSSWKVIPMGIKILSGIPLMLMQQQGGIRLTDDMPLEDQFDLVATSIQSLPLRLFLRVALSIPLVREGFFYAPASRDNHHAFEGGLAAHSIETAVLFHRAASLPSPLSNEQIELGLTAALLHDIGKLVPTEDQPDIQPTYWRHEAAGLELLRHAFDVLPVETAKALRYCLHQYRFNEHESGRLIHCLRHADQLSSATCNEAVAQQLGIRVGDHYQLGGSGPARHYFAPYLSADETGIRNC